MPAKINIAEIQKAVRLSLPLTFKFTSLPPESYPLLDRIIEIYLAELGQEKIHEPLSYCVKELIANAQKANAKRIYFEEHGLEISRQEDYDNGMRGFLREIAENLDHFLQQLKQKNLSIDVLFYMRGEALTISVRNSAELTPRERARIYERIVRARAFHSFFEALETSLDSTEGAGLGIMILLQFLKRIGLGEESFSIEGKNGSTVSSIVIPISQVHLEQIRILSEAIVRDINSLPHFPENIVELIHLTDDPEVKIATIAKRIATDPALTADLLKQVNSGYYTLPAQVNSIPQAVKLVGIRGLRNLLYAYSSQKILDQKQAKMKSLWDHSFRTAYYAFLLARGLKRQPEILDDVYVAGLLHDLGQIIVSSLHPETHEKMRRFSMEKNIPPQLPERFSFGMNHADIGSLIAQKWNFPEQLVEGIKYHHDPLSASHKYKDIVFCVYLANAVCDLERGLISYEQLEKPVLGDFGIRTKEQFLGVASKLRSTFEKRHAELSGH